MCAGRAAEEARKLLQLCQGKQQSCRGLGDKSDWKYSPLPYVILPHLPCLLTSWGEDAPKEVKMLRCCLNHPYTKRREKLLGKELLLTWDLLFIKLRWYLSKLLLRNSKCCSSCADPTQSNSLVSEDKGVFIWSNFNMNDRKRNFSSNAQDA